MVGLQLMWDVSAPKWRHFNVTLIAQGGTDVFQLVHFAHTSMVNSLSMHSPWRQLTPDMSVLLSVNNVHAIILWIKSPPRVLEHKTDKLDWMSSTTRNTPRGNDTKSVKPGVVMVYIAVYIGIEVKKLDWGAGVYTS